MPVIAPINVNAVQAETGFQLLKQGWYLLKLLDASQVRATKSGDTNRRIYKTEIVMGPAGDGSTAGRKFQDPIMENDQWAGRHMELYAACLGSPAAVRQAAMANGGAFDLECLTGKYYLAMVVVNDRFNNVVRRAVYTADNWNLILAGQDPEPIEETPGGGQAATAAPAVGAAPAPGGMMAPAPAPAPVAAPAPAPAPVAAAPVPAPVPVAGPPVPPTPVPTPGQ